MESALELEHLAESLLDELLDERLSERTQRPLAEPAAEPLHDRVVGHVAQISGRTVSCSWFPRTVTTGTFTASSSAAKASQLLVT